MCTTISPALPYALFDTAVSGASEKDQYNGKIVFDGVVESAKTALANGIPVALGNDVGCPYITQYDFWRELCYFHKYCGVSNQFALYTATLRNAQLAGVGDVTGSIEPGKSADFIVTKHNPLDDLRALQHTGTGGLPRPCDQKAEPQAEQNGGCPAGPVPRIILKKQGETIGLSLLFRSHACHHGHDALPALVAGSGHSGAAACGCRAGRDRIHGGHRHRRMKEHGCITGQPLGGKAGCLRVGLQGAALGTGQMIRQPVEDGTQRQAGQNIPDSSRSSGHRPLQSSPR